MFYTIFLAELKKIWKGIKLTDDERINTQELPKDVIKKEISAPNSTLSFNIYHSATESATKKPLIIDIHGGGWVYGSKDLNDNFLYHLVTYGANCISISYRLAPKVKVIDQIKDIYTQIKYILDHKEEFPFSFDSISLTGDSAGGQLALFFLIVIQDKKMMKKLKLKPLEFKVNSLILNHSTCFIETAGNLKDHPYLSKFVSIPGMKRLLFGSFYSLKYSYKLAKPEYFLKKGYTLPNILIITSKGDELYAPHSFNLKELLDRYDYLNQIYIEDNEKIGTHVFNISYPDYQESIVCNKNIIEFINQKR